MAFSNARQKRIDDLKRKLGARENKSEFIKNYEHLREEIAKLEAAQLPNSPEYDL